MKRISANTVEMTNQRDGKIVFVVRLQVTPDGKAIHPSSKSKEDDSVKTWELHKNLNRLFSRGPNSIGTSSIHSLDGSQSSIGLPSGSLSHAKVPMEGYSSVFSITTPLLLRWLRTSPMFFTV